MNNKYQYHLLREEVAKNDAFQQKTHEHIADTIVSLIENEEGGTTIGLEGSWGSGKSTVISLMTRKLNNAKVFIFDAWAHEGDCLRRIFLESLLAHIINLLDKGELKGNRDWYQEKQKIIDKRLKKTRTGRHTSLTLLGTLMSFAFFLSTIASSLCEIVETNFSYKINILLIVLMLSPIILVICRAIQLLNFKRKGILLSSPWALIGSDTNKSETTNEVSEEEERSSIEFERIFTEIMKSLCENNPKVKFVFAIDNLDRVDPQNALILWSTMQTFLQNRSHNSEKNPEWFKRLWVIVPYDAEGLAKIWNATNTLQTEATADNQDSHNQEKQFAKSFFDKCFQVRFEVPDPVMTEWELFAKSCIKSACHNWPDPDKDAMLDVLRFTRADLTAIPTPREIKTYVNQVCVLRGAVAENISTEVICYYVITRYVNHNHLSVAEIRKRLIAGNYPEHYHKSYLPENYAAEFSGLIFGVAPELGHQFLLSDEIKSALNNNDYEKLKFLYNTHAEGFLHVWEHISSHSDLWPDHNNYLRFFNNCSCVIRSGIETIKTEKFIPKVNSHISLISNFPIQQLADIWTMNDDGISELIDTIKLNANNTTCLTFFFNSLFKACNENLLPEKNFVNNTTWNRLQQVMEAFPEDARCTIEFSNFNAENLLTLCNGATDFSLARWIKPRKEIKEELCALIKENSSIHDGLLDVLRYIFASEVFQDNDWNALVDCCRKHIQYNSGKGNAASFSTNALDLLLVIIANTPSVKDNIDNLLSNYVFYNYINSSDQENRLIKAMLLCATVYPEKLFARQIGNYEAYANSSFENLQHAWKENNSERSKNILEEALKFGLISKLGAINKEPENLLFGNFIDIALSNKRYIDLFSEVNCIELLHVYRGYLKRNTIDDIDNKLHQPLKYSAEHHKIDQCMENIILEEYADDYLYILNTEFKTEILQKVIEEACVALNKEKIITALQKDNSFLELIDYLRSYNKKFKMNYDFYSVLENVCKTESDDVKKIKEKWLEKDDIARILQKILPALGDYTDTFVNDVTDHFCKEDNCNSDEYWKLFRPIFSIKRMDNTFLNKMAWEAIHEKNSSKLRKIIDLLNVKSDWQADAQYTNMIQGALESWYREADESTIQNLNIIASKYNISIPAKTEE